MKKNPFRFYGVFLLVFALLFAACSPKPAAEESAASAQTESAVGVSDSGQEESSDLTAEPGEQAEETVSSGGQSTGASKAENSSWAASSKTSSAAVSSQPSGQTSALGSALKCYIGGRTEVLKIGAEHFLPAVAYRSAEGQLKDTMFDSFIFLPTPDWVYDYGDHPVDGGAAPYKKSDWLKYITNYHYGANGGNMGALDSAVGTAKQALGKSNYKPGVFLSLFTPATRVTDWGETEGRNLDLSKLEDQKAAVKWMVDEHIRQFKEKNYQNIKINGFYWFNEYMNFKDQSVDIAKYITDYIRSLGYITIWSPFYNASGYGQWKTYGFDLATMQANYFNFDTPNAGGEERLIAVANARNTYALGVEIEMENEQTLSITTTKKYLKAGVDYGYINGFNVYYFGAPKTIFNICGSKSAYSRSLYDDTYKFLKKTLKASDIGFK
ncbi:MAG: DUF4855 domain-containing protein [Oscillospiraceae bacterium]|jgi:hypothetical protein|nr:DUF4855 domain-containing protein [Oscillospiraceae bacterium]